MKIELQTRKNDTKTMRMEISTLELFLAKITSGCYNVGQKVCYDALRIVVRE